MPITLDNGIRHPRKLLGALVRRLVIALRFRTKDEPLAKEQTEMARKTVFVSDLSGDQIEEGKAAKIRITFDDARRGSYEVDATADEAMEIGRRGRQVARRGRKPKSAS